MLTEAPQAVYLFRRLDLLVGGGLGVALGSLLGGGSIGGLLLGGALGTLANELDVRAGFSENGVHALLLLLLGDL